MLYFTREGFRRLANQNRGHIRVNRVMLEYRNRQRRARGYRRFYND